jgi:oxygen-dependent protoporphyrinogen oxidase
LGVTVYEAGSKVAGLASTFRDADGFTYDFGAHYITNRLAAAVGVSAQCRVVPRYGDAVQVDGRVYGLPFGVLRSPRYVVSALRAVAARPGEKGPPQDAAERFRRDYGAQFADDIAIPLAESWSGVAASHLSPAVVDKLGSTLGILTLRLAGIARKRAVAIGYCREQPQSPHVWHVYPETGVSLICEALLSQLRDSVRLNSPVEAILVESNRVVGVRVAGRDIEASAVVSTAPVHALAKLVQGTSSLQHLSRFRYRPMVFVNLRFAGRGLLPDVVTWSPSRHSPFFRLTEIPLSMPWLAPEGKTLITADLGCEVNDETWSSADEDLGRRCLESLEGIVSGARRRYLGCRVLRTPIAYPVFLKEYEADRLRLAHSTGVEGLYSVGRNGEFAHVLMEDVYWRTVRRMRGLREWLAQRSSDEAGTSG